MDIKEKIYNSENVCLFEENRALDFFEKKKEYINNADDLNFLLFSSNADLDDLKLFSDLRYNLIGWLPFKKTDNVVILGNDGGSFSIELCKYVKNITIFDDDYSTCLLGAERIKNKNVKFVYGIEKIEILEDKSIDYMIFISPYTVANYETVNEDYLLILNKFAAKMKDDCKTLIVANNSLGLKYWAGCKDDVLKDYYISIEGYATSTEKGNPSLEQLNLLINRIGVNYKIFYPYPDLYFPMSIYSDSFLPGKNELTKNAFSWEERIVSFNEVNVWNNIIKNKLFKQFSNAYLVILTKDTEYLERLNIYTKYSNDRASEFSIRTDIYIDSNGNRHIKKIPSSDLSVKHLSKMTKWESQLNERYKDSIIKINKIIESSGELEFEYIEGTPLLERLEYLLSMDNWDEFLNLFKTFTDVLIERNRTFFELTDEFRRVFGNVQLPSGLLASKSGNIDLILSNILCSQDNMSIIDYEWMFDFPIPINFMIYRSIDYLFRGPRGQLNFNPIYKTRLFELFSIDEKEQDIYEIMEHNFQEYVRGKRIPLRMMNRTAPLVIMSKRPVVFYDFGKGFSKANSYETECKIQKDGSVRVVIGLPYGVKNVRLDPTEEKCLVQIHNIFASADESVSYETNGKKLNNSVYLYDTIDPQIIIPVKKDGSRRLVIDFTLKELSDDIVDSLLDDNEELL